ncbi:hypothetical protein HGRIS_008620 [Hohenbuehelia grisea]|uniref:Uncharacterized protein n=1 Tax=Hohenbuehelia grisea TaxID=104357 RepID=A0ABR3J926_9AGAR
MKFSLASIVVLAAAALAHANPIQPACSTDERIVRPNASDELTLSANPEQNTSFWVIWDGKSKLDKAIADSRATVWLLDNKYRTVLGKPITGTFDKFDEKSTKVVFDAEANKNLKTGKYRVMLVGNQCVISEEFCIAHVGEHCA